MNKREKETFQGQLDAEDKVLSDLSRMYKRALRDIELKIRMLQSDELTQSRIYQIEYQKALKGQIEGILDKLHGDEYSTIQQYLSDTYTDAFVGTMYAMHGQGVPVMIPIDRNAAVKAVVTDSKLSVPLYASLGYDMDKLKKHVREEITRGIASSLPYLKPGTRTVHHEAVQGVQEVWHYETVAQYPNGGKDIRKVVDVPGVEAKAAWDEEIEIQIYVPYTQEELDRMEAERNKPTMEDRLAALEEENRQLKEALDLLLSGATEEANMNV